MFPDPKLPSLAVTVCAALSLFTHVTVLLTPIATVTWTGEKEYETESAEPESILTKVVSGEEALLCCHAVVWFARGDEVSLTIEPDVTPTTPPCCEFDSATVA